MKTHKSSQEVDVLERKSEETGQKLTAAVETTSQYRRIKTIGQRGIVEHQAVLLCQGSQSWLTMKPFLNIPGGGKPSRIEMEAPPPPGAALHILHPAVVLHRGSNTHQ